MTTEHNLPLITRGRYENTLYFRDSMYGTPYAVGLMTDDEGISHTVLTDGRTFDLDHLSYLKGLDVKVTPTERGLKMQPLEHQPDQTTSELIDRLEKGTGHVQSRPPELLEDLNPPKHPAADFDNPMVPVIGELISYVAKVSMENSLPAAGWAFIPPGPGYSEDA